MGGGGTKTKNLSIQEQGIGYTKICHKMEIYAVIKKNPFREHLIKVNFSNCIICTKDIHKYPHMFRIKI